MPDVRLKDFVKILKEKTTIIIDLGADEHNECHLTPYHKAEHGQLIVENIFFVNENGIGIKVI